MPSCTDPLQLSDNKLFQELRGVLSKSEKETRNILDIRDNILYVWNADKCYICTLNVADVRDKNGKALPYQTLQPTDPPLFEITNLLINESTTQLALWGDLGIVIVELPRKWGKNNAFKGGKEFITCVNHNLNSYSSQLGSSEIRRVRWHPGSSHDNHLLVLTSENAFQLYECELGSVPKMIKRWKVGRSPLISPNKNMPTMESLGETAVDFDFSTPTMKMEKTLDGQSQGAWSEIDWPILVLRGDGNVLLVRGNILYNHNSSSMITTKVSIFPSAVDNYGVDSCSIMCIPTTPPIVIIATCTGVIYHGILMTDNNPKSNISIESEQSRGISLWNSMQEHSSTDELFVIECVEMELGLLFNDNDKKYHCPIQLHRDRENKSRYFSSHNAGIHMITLPVVSQFYEFMNCSKENVDLFIPSSFNASSSQYLLCTRTKHTGKDDATPVLGFGVLQQPCPLLIALLHSGIIVDLSIVDLDYLPRVEPPKISTSPSKKITREPFDAYIKNLLMHDSTSQPITKLNATSQLTGKECFQLLDRATTLFRNHHFVKHDRVRNEIGKKVRALKALKTHQLKELEYLIKAKDELQSKAHYLAERYEDIKEKQEKLAKRAEEVLRLMNCKELTSAERADAAELRELDNTIQKLAVRLGHLKRQDAHQMTAIDYQIVKKQIKESVLSSKQEAAIKDQLQQMGKDIAKLISQIKSMEE